MRAATKVYSLSSGKWKGEWHMGQLSLSGMTAPYRRLVRTCLSTRLRAPVNRTGANERSRELMLATRCRADARNRCGRMALIRVHGESYYGAHRLPAGKTAAKECGAGVVLVRRRN